MPRRTDNEMPAAPRTATAAAIAVCVGLTACSPAAEPSADNPFFVELNDPVLYADVTAEHVTEYADRVLTDTDERASALRAEPNPSFDNIVEEFDDMMGELGKAQSNGHLLFWVSPDSATRAAGLSARQLLDSLSTVLYSDRGIYDQLSVVASSDSLEGPAAKLVADVLRAMRHTGVELSPADLARYKATRAEVDELSAQFTTNMNADIPTLELNEAGARGLPESLTAAYRTDDGQYEIPVMPVTSGPFMSNAEDPEMRRAFLVANTTRAAEQNMPILDQLRAKRHEIAQIMGRRSFAEYTLTMNMAESPDRVWDFLDDLIDRTQDKASADHLALREFRQARSGGSVDAPTQPWNRAFLGNQILKSEYGVDAERIREYLVTENALRGMMDLYQELLGLRFEKVENSSVWHEEVDEYHVYEDEDLIGRFYLDLYPRPNKETWFYGVGLTAGSMREGGYEIPVSMLLGNFTRPTEDRPSMISHAELSILFHEFGHVMNGMSYRGPHALQAGSRTDFGEAMSQIFENWIWDYDVLSSFAQHFETGEVLPRDLFDNMLAARSFNSGLSAQGGLRRAVYDMMLYDRFDPENPMDTDEIWRSIRDRFEVGMRVDGTHPQASWIHINGWPVYYYGYLWSAVYSADMFTQFEEHGLRDQETGRRYRELILANGTQRPIEDVVEEFLGRPMNNEAYIKSLGLGG